MITLPSLESLVLEIDATVQSVSNTLAECSINQLNYKDHPQKWSALECIAHLNKYSDYYNLEIINAIKKSKATTAPLAYKLSWFGKKSIKMVDPSNGKSVQTLKKMNPVNSHIDSDCLVDFFKHQKELKIAIQEATKINYLKKKVRVEFMKFIKMNIYESIYFMTLHQKRHIQQAINMVNLSTSK